MTAIVNIEDPFTTITLANLGLALKPIPAGTFTMGSPVTEPHRDADEAQHQVTLTSKFWMGESEVTVGQFRAFLQAKGNEAGVMLTSSDCPLNNDRPNYSLRGAPFGTSLDQPMTKISWDAAMNFCKWLNTEHAAVIPTGYEFRLPTEAEWEYCCRAGSTTAFSHGDDSTADGVTYANLGTYAVYDANSSTVEWPDGFAGAIKGKTANAWGLYGMHGNLSEWCHDWHGSYGAGAITNPTGPYSGTKRVKRGGSYGRVGSQCRS
ncbi:MAG: formylglycine-generating enzyme family protein, partial [Planctomycetes bacterium]|nr:formylglycine-generating enzyme family protein [Planctomycetota bacterium]